MFKSGRWRSDKNRPKEVFKLHFHATQVPLSVGDALMLAVVPGNVGKPRVKLDKAIVKEGKCTWDRTVYETVKFFRDSKTGKISEKIYNFVVSNGNQKSSVSGEVSVDLADYAETTKTCSLSLPFKSSFSGAILHVSIQRMLENADEREPEKSKDVKNIPDDKSLKTNLSNSDLKGSVINTINEAPYVRAVSYADLNSNRRGSYGSDIMSGSECSFEVDTPRDLAVKNKNIQQDPCSFVPSLGHNSVSHKSTSSDSLIHQEHQRSQWEWSLGSDGLSADDSSNNSHDNLQRENSLKCSDTETEKLKIELAILTRQAEVSEMELQTLRKQIVKDSKRMQDFLKEVSSLREERDALKADCESLRAFKKPLDDGKLRSKGQFEEDDPWVLLEELRQELSYEKDLNANLRVQLQKTHESNSELILAVQDMDETLGQRNREILDLSNEYPCSEKARVTGESFTNCETEADEDQKALEEIVKDYKDAKDAAVLHQEIIDLRSEIQMYKRDKDDLEMQMEQLALDYEILKQENHDFSYRLEQSQVQEQLKMQYECSGSLFTINELEGQIENLENELKNQGEEFADSLATISVLEQSVKSLEEELERRAQDFQEDLESIISTKVEQEQRAIRAEEALRKMKLKNVNTAEMLQEEFKRLSMHMASTFASSEKTTLKAMAEANELRLQNNHQQELLHKANVELQSVREDYEEKVRSLSLQINVQAHQIENMLSEIEDKTNKFEFQKEHEKEMHRNLSNEIKIQRCEIERLTAENIVLIDQRDNLRVELEQMKASIEDTELLLLRMSMGRDELEDTVALVRKETEKSMEELNIMACLKHEKESSVENLQSQLGTLKIQYKELKDALCKSEAEKPQTQVAKLVVSNVESSNDSKGVREIQQNSRALAVTKSSEAVLLTEEVKTPTYNESDQSNLVKLMSEMSILKEKNELMETELKEMQERYSDISVKFAEVEGERQRLVMSLRSFKNSKKMLAVVP